MDLSRVTTKEKDTRAKYLGLQLRQYERLVAEILDRMDSEEHPAVPIELAYDKDGISFCYRCSWCARAVGWAGRLDWEIGRKPGWHEPGCLYIRARYLAKGY